MSTSSQSWVGIDLGTSTTLVADGANVLALGTTNPWIPSVVALGDSGLVIGEAAEHLDPSRVLRSPKRYITESHHAEALERPPAGLDPLEALEQLLRVAVEKSRALGVDVRGQGVRLGCAGPPQTCWRSGWVRAGRCHWMACCGPWPRRAWPGEIWP